MDARNEIEAQQSLLNGAIVERDAVQDLLGALQTSHASCKLTIAELHEETKSIKVNLATARSELIAAQADRNTLREQLDALRLANNAVDTKISAAIRKREAYWRMRLEEMETERQLMVKSLMKQWGRQEVGVEDPQAYWYKYVSRSPRRQDAQAL